MYETLKNLPKEKGEPELTFDITKTKSLNSNLPTENFSQNQQINNAFSAINNSSKLFFKWLLKI